MSVFVDFVGRLGADAETVTTGTTQFISCRVAVDESVKKEQKTRWISVNGNLDTFKNVKDYLTKGKLVHVHGVERLVLYTTKSGENTVDTRVWADNISFIAIGKPNESQGGEASKKDEQNAKMLVGTSKKPTTKTVEPEEPSMEPDDDLPF
jgi:single stranded DNA-binding protein